MQRYLSLGAENVFVYAIAYTIFSNDETKELTSVFEKNIIQKEERVISTFGTMQQMCKLLNVKKQLLVKSLEMLLLRRLRVHYEDCLEEGEI